ncbi:chemotaxis protein CheA [Bryobacter aggregatus]|uniref:chemotaxis protein CheA n=1 Tax=Bryobacter aggregatus TaxID=360054 RepID=UPI000B0AFC7A|nr:chemotaxis protein CheA [Bryobacter aggregatus]
MEKESHTMNCGGEEVVLDQVPPLASGGQDLDRLGQVLAEALAAPPASSSALNQDPELVGDFINESREHLQTVEKGLLVLEKEPSNPETLNAVFRSFHTIKGLAGFLEFGAIQEIAHEVETILDQARTGLILMSPSLIDLTLESADFVGTEIQRIEVQLQGNEPGPPLDASALLQRVRTAIAGGSTPAPAAVVVAKDPHALPSEPEVQEAKAKQRAPAQDAHSIRVETAKLDSLLDMVGEMVIAEAMVRLDPELAAIKNPKLQRNLNQLRRVTEEVQKIAMATRLVPVGTLFQRVNRLVRDTSRKAGKMAEVELFGEDTQLDKTIVEELTDPIMHMVRNSIDHGLEAPADRRAADKPETGRIQLRAYRQADHIQIEIADDGRGLNRDKILAKAQERGLLVAGTPLSDPEIFQLIFEPGFSTADQVTDISGRGVGMDVVKKQIQKLRGKIEIQSTAGAGTTFYLKLPLTLAIVDGLVVGVGRERLILPIFSVQEMFRPAADQVFTVQGRDEMVMVRNHLLPLIRLDRSLGVKARQQEPGESLLIVAETEGRGFVLMVDEFLGKQEVVIKSLGESLRNTPGIAGGAILGDGRVGLILDLEAIYNRRQQRAQTLRESVLLAC